MRDEGWHGLPSSADLMLPPLAVLWLVPAQAPEQPEEGGNRRSG